MSGIVPSHDVVVVREGDAEIVGTAPVTGRLYADSSATGGAARLAAESALSQRDGRASRYAIIGAAQGVSRTSIGTLRPTVRSRSG